MYKRQLFAHPLARLARVALVSAGSVAQAVSDAEADTWEERLLSRLAVSEPDGTPAEAVHRLVHKTGSQAMENLEAELRQAARDGVDADVRNDLLTEHAWLARRVDQLNEPETAEVSARALVAYLRGDDEEEVRPGVDSGSGE